MFLYGEDLQSVAGAIAWAEAADQKRPWRFRFRDFIAERIATLGSDVRVLELGSGPGFLAERVLQVCSKLASYTLVDFSEPMLAMSRERIAPFSAASFVLSDFRSGDWPHTVKGPFDCVVSMQSVHEVRHKRRVPKLYEQVYSVTVTSGLVLICDHTPKDDSWHNTSLFMTEEEQLRALSGAGFVDVTIAMSINGLVLYACRKAA